MRQTFRLASLGFFVLALVPFAVDAQGKAMKGSGTTTQATAQDYAALRSFSQIDGKLVSVDPTKITISIEKSHSVRGASSGGKKSKPSVTVQKDHIEFELPVKEKAALRKMYLASGYDEKGNPKVADEKTKAKLGAGGLPGYPADLSDFVAGTIIRIHLEAPKKAGSATSTKKDEEPDLSTRPTVKMITALVEPKETLDTSTKKKKK